MNQINFSLSFSKFDLDLDLEMDLDVDTDTFVYVDVSPIDCFSMEYRRYILQKFESFLIKLEKIE